MVTAWQGCRRAIQMFLRQQMDSSRQRDMTDMKIQALVRIHAVMKVILQKKRKQRYAGKSQLSRKCIKC